jgi:hypothetical protein
VLVHPLSDSSTANFSAGPTAKLEHVAERFSAFYSDLEQEKQVCSDTKAGVAGHHHCCADFNMAAVL